MKKINQTNIGKDLKYTAMSCIQQIISQDITESPEVGPFPFYADFI